MWDRENLKQKDKGEITPRWGFDKKDGFRTKEQKDRASERKVD